MHIPATSLLQSLAFFTFSAACVWVAGARLAYLADALADRFKLGKSLVGLLLLSLATSLPEVATTLSAAAQQSRNLVLNNLFGGIALQTAILAMADFWAHGPITNYPRKANHALEATLLVLLLSVTLIITNLGETFVFAGVGLGSLCIAVIYGGAIWLLRRYDASSDWVPVDLPDPEPLVFPAPTGLGQAGNVNLIWQAVFACIAILVFGLLLVVFADRIADQSGLGTGFIGVTLLAGATSLPELSTSIAAVRIGAYTMAISNIFGSNLIMLVLVFPADILFRSGPILQNTSPMVSLSLAFGLTVTSIYLVGLIVRRKPWIGSIGLDSILVMLTFLASIAAYYYVR
ncbi:sodium:calcium antiporter [Roseobacter sp. GAI101]|uniref:sodium:calcium antiporter n=1 Tax=Roseobacter sp. (strain GAI101) TaxID=391589 RepID=UPI000187157B|nr:cation antiporter [Roseobacter sp. GAI101]EEB82673.1 cation antiporter [Roseobacter sp. GAI101]